MNLPKIHSITKKICVALLGGFLLIFLLFHACANLCILRHDGGTWYGDFCHFMGTNYIVKVFEIVLLGFILLHILLTVWLWITSQLSRPVKYHHASRTKTHTGSKLMIWTGILIFALLIVHFCDFYFVKLGWVKGQYMVKTEELTSPEINAIQQATAQYGMSAEDFIAANEQQFEMYADQLDEEQKAEIQKQIDALRAAVPVASIIENAQANDALSADGKWLKKLSAEDKAALEEALPEAEIEPDFYNLTRQKFHNPLMAFIYLCFFVIVWFHMRHAFASAFQTLGLNNYKYNTAIEVIAQIYAWFVCLAFAAVVILVFLGL
ncbi:MAG: hypothetical protein MJZ45_05125 [Bacteroidales bacterium]|nr:hypothetical protein [Bacteroidales bacterium]